MVKTPCLKHLVKVLKCEWKTPLAQFACCAIALKSKEKLYKTYFQGQMSPYMFSIYVNTCRQELYENQVLMGDSTKNAETAVV